MIDKKCVSSFNFFMTILLEKEIDRISALPAKKQNEIARLLLAEMDATAQWDKSFKSSQPELAKLASVALAEHRGGKTRSMNFSNAFLNHGAIPESIARFTN